MPFRQLLFFELLHLSEYFVYICEMRWTLIRPTNTKRSHSLLPSMWCSEFGRTIMFSCHRVSFECVFFLSSFISVVATLQCVNFAKFSFVCAFNFYCNCNDTSKLCASIVLACKVFVFDDLNFLFNVFAAEKLLQFKFNYYTLCGVRINSPRKTMQYCDSLVSTYSLSLSRTHTKCLSIVCISAFKIMSAFCIYYMLAIHVGLVCSLAYRFYPDNTM